MSVFESVAARRSVKHYDPSFVMPEADVQKLFEAAILSPSSFNIQHWRIVRVADQAKREAIRAAAWGQAQVTEASLLLVLTADVQAWAKNPGRYWANAPQAAQDQIVPAIHNFYNGREQVQRDEAMRSVGIMAQTLMLSAKEMGYDSCPMIGFDPQAVGQIINLPSDHVIGMMLVIGKALKPANPRAGQLPLSDVVVTDAFAS